jgi:hypothetical protein
MFRARLILFDAADPAGEPWSRRLQASATDGPCARCAAAAGRARGHHACCHGGAGAANGRRIGPPTARSGESQGPNEGAEPASRAPCAPATTRESDQLRVPTVFRRLSAHVLKNGDSRPSSAEMLNGSRGGETSCGRTSPKRKNRPLQLADLVIVTNPHPPKRARLGGDAGRRLTLKDDGPSCFLTSAARRSGTGCFISVYSALSTFPSANSHGFPARISGRADGFRIGRSLRDASYEGGPTKPINRLTNARDPEVPKRGR